MSKEEIRFEDKVEVILKNSKGKVKEVRKSKNTVEEIDELVLKILRKHYRP